MKRGRECAVHKHSTSAPQEDHHILPREFGGKTAPSNMVRICSNAHGDVHYFLALLMKHGGVVPLVECREFGFRAQRLAKDGYQRMLEELPLHEFDRARGVMLARLEERDD